MLLRYIGQVNHGANKTTIDLFYFINAKSINKYSEFVKSNSRGGELHNDFTIIST